MTITEKIGLSALLGQGAEECCELGQALLKYQRLDPEWVNRPAYDDADALINNIVEEIADVENLILLIRKALDISQNDVCMIRDRKMKRWAARLGLTTEEQ